MKYVTKFVPSAIRPYIAPITMRFTETDELLAALDLLDCVDYDGDDKQMIKFARKASFQIANELVRRKVRFWEI
jgi:hypothetical protein